MLQFFRIDMVMNLINLHTNADQRMTVVVLDEINFALQALGPIKLKEMLTALASFICASSSTKQKGLKLAAQFNQIILPVICGTVTSGIFEAVSGFGWVDPSLQYLSKGSIESIYKAYFSKDILQLSYLDTPIFCCMLLYYGTVPHSVEYFLQVVCKQKNNFEASHISISNGIEAKLNAWIKLCCWTFIN